MTQRERTMATVLGGGVILAVGVIGFLVFFSAYVNSQQAIENLEKQIAENQAKIDNVIKGRANLERWRQLSNGFAEDQIPAIPIGNLELISRNYREYLETSFRTHSLAVENFGDAKIDIKSPVVLPGRAGKVPIYTGVSVINVRLKGKLPGLVSFLQEFQRKPYMHRIPRLSIERSTSAKDDMLTLTMSFECLVIVDAEKVTKRSKIPDKTSVAVDTALGFRMAFPGMGVYAWWLSPQSPSVKPVNQLSTARQYDDIPKKNFFIGPVPFTGGPTTTPTPKKDFEKGGARWPDEMINMMRFNRLVSMTVDGDGKAEAHLWDMFFNLRQRLAARGGFDSFRMLQTGKAEPLIQGKVVKVENNDIVFRVLMKAIEPVQKVKWWRYPEGNDYYVVHDDDLKTLVDAKKAKADEKGKLYLLNMPYWESLTAKGAEKIEVAADRKTFWYKGKTLRGDIVDADWSAAGVVILRFANGTAPPKTPVLPSISSVRVYPEKDKIYRIQYSHFDDLVASKKTSGGKNATPLKKDDLERVFAVPTPFWDMLFNQKVVTTSTTGGRSDFYFKYNLICGEIIDWNDEMVVIRQWEHYCKCPADPERGIPEDRWHEGFLILPLERYVADALMTPVPESRMKEFLPKK